MSESERQVEITSFATFGSIMSVLMIASVVGNIICFRLTRRMVKNKPSLVLVLNLNISDILVTLCTWAAFMTQHISRQMGTDIDVVVHKLFWSAIITLGNMTILTLTGLAADCFIALRWPLHYRDISTQKATRIYISIAWILSVISGFGDFLAAASNYSGSYSEAVRDTMVFSSSEYQSIMSKLTASLTMFLSNSLSVICLFLLIIIYSYVLAKIKKIKLNKTLSKQGGFRSQVHAVRTTLMIFTSFLLLFVPTLAVNIVTVIQPDFLSKLSLIEGSFIGYMADCLLLVHSMVDALIYGVRVSKTIHRQRRTQLTMQDYIRQSRAGSNYTTSFSSYSLSPSRQDTDGITTLAQHCIDRVSSVSFGVASLNLKERCNTLQTISETGETLQSDMHESAAYDEPAEHINSEYNRVALEYTIDDYGETLDDDSVDEGIGTHSESGSDEHDIRIAEMPLPSPAPVRDSGQSQIPPRSQLVRNATSTLLNRYINTSQHRKALYKRSRSLNDIHHLLPSHLESTYSLLLLDRIVTANGGGIINPSFISDYNSNKLHTFSKLTFHSEPTEPQSIFTTPNTEDFILECNDNITIQPTKTIVLQLNVSSQLSTEDTTSQRNDSTRVSTASAHSSSVDRPDSSQCCCATSSRHHTSQTPDEILACTRF